MLRLGKPNPVSTARPVVVSSTLPGSTRPCTIPAACAAVSADRTQTPILAACGTGNGRRERTVCSSDAPETNSITSHGSPSSTSTSSTRTTKACRSAVALRASCSAASRSSGGTRRRLTATSRCSVSSKASRTDPAPKGFNSR